MVKIKVLLTRNKYYKDNPILLKDNFTAEDEVEIVKFLKRVKHPLLLTYKKPIIVKTEKTPFKPPPRATPETTENYTTYASTLRYD